MKPQSIKDWPRIPGLWPYCGIRWLDDLSKRLGDFVEAQEFHWSERKLAKAKQRVALKSNGRTAR